MTVSRLTNGLKALNLSRSALGAIFFALAVSPDRPAIMYGADAVAINRAARDYKLPEQIDWQVRPGTPNYSATAFGDPAKQGFVVSLLKRGPNDWSTAHSHPYDRIITVLAGTFLIGTGDKVDRKNTVALPVGSIIKDFANQMHYDGTGPQGATIEIITMGPTVP